ncbi:excisionase family DNA binding protein [Saccharothrix carnea]|uniref:Excisionase family DNA binding protein n=1 Tax=Saccharothrix carnea TaxID=1280637 RepID=A0A2P8HZD1_SACCR|nr:helix-turn-helix domain-containing protein [Saccharothrix carnea]PSL51534.1 excisionase family DNA binding protein [Saccharothrix carnea]
MDYPYGDRLFATTSSPSVSGDVPEPVAPQPETQSEAEVVAMPARLLHTPAQAARLLAVRESWLRRMAGRREIACTFVGKHLRFSDEDLRSIVQRGSRPARGDRATGHENHGPHLRRRAA